MWPFNDRWTKFYRTLEKRYAGLDDEIIAARKEIIRLQEAHSIAMATIKLLRTELQTHKNYTHKDPKTGKFTKDKSGG